jgi:uncharacterized delta-60 repeat protein
MNRLLVLAAILFLAHSRSFSQAGSLDKSFNATGIVQTQVGPVSFNTFPNAVAIQPSDQKILVAGEAVSSDGHRSFAVVRYLPNGTLDPAFGTGGIAIISIGEDTYGASGLAVQSSGKIVLVGQFFVTVSGTGYTFGAIMRLTTAGILDNSFAGGGEENVIGLGAQQVVLQTNDEIIVGGTYETYIGVMRFSKDGVKDMQWGGNGVSVFDADPNNDDILNAMAIQPNGRVVVAGMSFWGGNQIMVGRLTTSGSADPSFGTNGKMFITVGINDELVGGQGLAIQSNGKILVNGSYSAANGNTPLLVVRLNTDGTFDNSFAGNGKLGITIGDICYGGGLAIQSNGQIVVAGEAGPGGGPFSLVMVRLNSSNGSLDASFGFGGIVNTVFNTGTIGGTSVAIQANGRIVATTASQQTTNDYLYTTVRYLATGTAGASTTDEQTESRATGFDPPTTTAIRLYPNPATSLLRVDGLDASLTATLVVTDASGHTVLTAKSERQSFANLNISNFPAGVYFLEILTTDKKRTITFMKAR